MEMPKITDARGNLTAIEGGRDMPFPIHRVYYVYDVPSGSVRAGHAHRTLHQLFLALSGSFTIHLDDGRYKASVALNRPHIGLYVQPGVWRVIDDFSGGAVCLVLASAIYDEGAICARMRSLSATPTVTSWPTIRADLEPLPQDMCRSLA